MDEAPVGGRRGASLGTVIGLLVVGWGAVIGSFPLNDNSFLTHLATGRLILDRGSVPSSDPYTFTAAGEPWTVQSWLASVAYAGAEAAAGTVGLRLLAVAVFATAAGLLWRLSRPATSLVPRLLLVSAALFVVTTLWTPRPFMVGVIGLALVWLALHEAVPPWTLVPLLWVWGNSHGSFPLAVGLVVVVGLGRRLDGDGLGPVRPVGIAVVVGTLAAALGPLGLRALTFPVTAVTRADVLAEIAEWQAPAYRSVGERAFLVLLAVAALAVARSRRWSLVLPVVAFGLAGVVAQRNLVMATVVLVGATAPCLGSVGTLRSTDRPRLGTAFAAVAGFGALLLALGAVTTPSQALQGYPIRALALVGAVDPSEVHVATEDRQGNLLTVLDGATGAVFVDDRVDMLPASVFADELTLVRGRPGWDAVLDRYDIDVVVWAAKRPLAPILAADDRWRIAYAESGWIVACRRTTGCAGLDGLS